MCVGKFTASLFSYRMGILDSDGMRVVNQKEQWRRTSLAPAHGTALLKARQGTGGQEKKAEKI